jgi:peptidoglycan hydrolase-like protein with peptidoglycan-binding domain
MKSKLLSAAALGLLLTACGTDPQERTTGGAAAGAATGAGIGALGGPAGALAGAAIGAGAGAVTGAVTEPRDVNLGEPPWSNPEARVPGVTGNRQASARAASSDPRTRQLQQALNDRGYRAGPVDGIMGPQTRSAVREWQRSNNMEATGTPSSQMLSDLNIGSGSGMAGRSGDMMNNDRRTGTTGGAPGGSDSGGSGGSMNNQGRSSQ